MGLFKRVLNNSARSAMKSKSQVFLTYPYLEIPGTKLSCQKKAVVNAWIYQELKKGSADPDVLELALMVSLLQPCQRESYTTAKSIRKNMLDIGGETISLKEADQLLKEMKPQVLQSFEQRWDLIAASCKDAQNDADIVFDFLEKENMPIMAAIYIGSPTLDEVMQHRFQYVYRMHFDEGLKRYYAPPQFDEKNRACGQAPVMNESAVIFHMGIPNQCYNQLSTKRFLQAFPEQKITGHTALAKLNLPHIDLKKMMAYSLHLMNLPDNRIEEPGLPLGDFLYPLSLYHFSFAPRWPEGGQDSYLGQPLWSQNFIDFKFAGHRDRYEGEYSPLEIYGIFPNPFYGPFGNLPGFEFRIKKNGRHIKLRLFAGKNALYPRDHKFPLPSEFLTHDKDIVVWDWDLQKSRLTVQEFINEKLEYIELNEVQARKYFFEITSALKVHLQRNFCFKTRFLISIAGINQESFNKHGVLSEENAYRYYLNGIFKN